MEATSEELFGQRESQLKLASKETRSFGGRKVLLASNASGQRVDSVLNLLVYSVEKLRCFSILQLS